MENVGEFINHIFAIFPNKIKKINGSEIIFTKNLLKKHNFEVYSFNPRTKQSSWQPVAQLIRHKSPKQLWKINTGCGREITTTGDHNFFALRNSKLTLMPTNKLRKNDYLPLPLSLREPSSTITFILLSEHLDKRKLYVSLPQFAVAWNSHKSSFRQIIAPAKIHNILHKGERISFELYQRLANIVPEINQNAVIGSHKHNYQLPLEQPLTNHFLRLLGYYIAEGHAEKSYFIISSGSREIISDFTRSLRELNVKWRQRPKTYDYQISSSLWSEFFATVSGKNSKTKHFPKFWPQLSKTHLANLLRAYFSADGGVDGLTVSCTTASQELASDIMYALLRFDIIARSRKRTIKIPNKNTLGKYWTICVSGQKFLKIFQDKIGFSISSKNKKLNKIIKTKYNTNVDVIPITNWLLEIRNRLSLSQQKIAQSCGIDRSYVSIIEHGKRMPSREVFKKIITLFEKYATKSKRPNIVKEIVNKNSFLNLYWTPVKGIERTPGKDYVYDFAVKDNETFLAGEGGVFVHNTFTMAKVIEKAQRPVLVISHNKTLAAQLYQEFKGFFPQNAVHYFVSYYDYYQPEAYIPQTDTYIEKDSRINEEIDRLRHAATQDLMTRPDVIVVASVSCIYNIGSPKAYKQVSLEIKSGQKIRRRDFISHLASLQYQRNDIDPKPGTFRVRGDIIEISLVTGEKMLKIDFSGDKIDACYLDNHLTSSYRLFPAHFWVTPESELGFAIENIKLELEERLKELKKQKKLPEAQRLKQKTNYDIEMMEETGFCHGIENYSRHLEFRKEGSSPFTLLDYYSKDFLVFIDESHITCSQLRAMAVQDRARKESLIEYGFRLPSAVDNRPLTFGEFNKKIGQTVYVSATPNEYEKEKAGKDYIVEQFIRPTGLLEPAIEIRSTKDQIMDLVRETKKRAAKKQKTLVVVLTKRLAEAVSDYLLKQGIKTQWFHSEIKTLERPQILKDLRDGKYDALVGINLLREGLDLPEVTLVAILDADKEGFLRSATTLIQTMGRAARHPEGRVILYADQTTKSMAKAIKEVSRRRKIQENYNKKYKVTPRPIIKESREWPFGKKEEITPEFGPVRDIELLKKEVAIASKYLDFERAANIRDLIKKTKTVIDKTGKRT
ncbi:MAG: excinuclease ABC subunit UvrB [bacterium]|nr:excinuclease ABC subunit UvrB [bacterium]